MQIPKKCDLEIQLLLRFLEIDKKCGVKEKKSNSYKQRVESSCQREGGDTDHYKSLYYSYNNSHNFLYLMLPLNEVL